MQAWRETRGALSPKRRCGHGWDGKIKCRLESVLFATRELMYKSAGGAKRAWMHTSQRPAQVKRMP